MKKIVNFVLLFLFVSFIPVFSLHAQGGISKSVDSFKKDIWRAGVIQVLDEKEEDLPGMGLITLVQTLQIRFLDGEYEGEVVYIESDYIQLEAGDNIFVSRIYLFDGEEHLSIVERDRSFSLMIILLLFVVTISVIGGKKGIRSLISLIGSLLIIVYILIPILVMGYSPLLISIIIATCILFFVILFTYGYNRNSYVVLGGTVGAVIVTGLLAVLVTEITGLTGFASDESVYLNVATGGQLNFVGLLLGAIIIGVLGVLDDVAVTQVSVVNELYKTNKTLTQKELYYKAMNVGKDHVGSMVNTLALAYTGTALPLLLLLSQSQESFLLIVNKEIFTTEIVRTLVGSIGLILTVPITTFLAVYFLTSKNDDTDG